MPLRPILKALHVSNNNPQFEVLDTGRPISHPLPFAACSSRMVMFSPHVHFPTHPCTLTGAAHSPGSYDRAPIPVSPNSCAIPERGGRVYAYNGSPMGSPKGSYFHPHAYEAWEAPERQPEADEEEPVPEFGHFSSESSEYTTDECASPDPGSPPAGIRIAPIGGGHPLRSRHSQEHVLSFLPHPHPPTPGSGLHPVKRERRKRPRPRRRSEDAEDYNCLGGF
ncbi:hypothetical protein HMN09_00873100 [Mycena chlorophos]|uniref:Uncharacterized protein n=1 Tax=Mycena chlorophos TaxID=658473 RepID=A0A8H6W7S9_MYCCL|nr:hypothetical protein HMN09_00873100 [Mycena chlorophos]